MKKIITEIIISQGKYMAIYSERRIKISIRDEAAGPYLAIEGFNDEPDIERGEESQHEFYLCSEKEIDEFSKICKSILKEANEVCK